MEGSASSINSRATAIKTILLAAWRSKLSDEEWENRIRKVLPKGVNGDVYDLADCLLKQALVGPVPNQLFISYLKHAVKCELVSHAAVLTSMANQSINIRQANLQPHRASSVVCLLEFIKSFRDRISCDGTEIECLNLCYSLNQLINWLLKCVQNSLEVIVGFTPAINVNATPLNTNPTSNNPTVLTNIAQQEQIIGMIDLCTETIHYFINRPFTKSLLFISKIEYSTEFDEILRTVQLIQQRLSTSSCPQPIQDRIQHCKTLLQVNTIFNSRDMHPSVVAAHQLRCLQLHRIRSTQITLGSKNQQPLLVHDSTSNHALFNSLYSLIAFDVVLRPARSHKLLARQIATISSYNSAPVHMTYCELIRVCMIGLIDTDGTSAKIKWAFFTFLKIPKLLIELSKIFRCHPIQLQAETSDCFNSNTNTTTFINDLKLAFERLCEYSPLLDEAEYKCNCDFFKCLMKELIKNDPSLAQLKNLKFTAKRTVIATNDNSVGGHMMLKTEPFVTSMLETFDSEQDPVELFELLSKMVSGRQFEFTLSAAASTGRLQMFVNKLVEHNELNRAPRTDSPKNPQIQALIFDITFLILTYIAQQFGPDVIGSEQQTLFNKWFYDCYNPATRVNCPKEMLKDANEDVVSSLIKQIASPYGAGVQVKSVNWEEVCSSLPKVINEILVAWNQGYLNDIQMSGIIERIKSKMCFFAVVTATWLQCHIRTTPEADKAKPLSLLQDLTKASQQAKQQKQQIVELGQKSDYYPERSSLMCSITRKIYFELVPKTNPPNQSTNTSALYGSSTEGDESHDESAYQSTNDKFISTLTTQEIFLANVKQCLSRGWIDHKSLNSLNSLFKMIGSECFTNLIVEQILTSHDSPSDLARAVNITFGLFHLDIEACAFALLKDTIPSWLMGEKKQVLLNQPRAFALAHLTVMTIIEVFSNLKASQDGTIQNEDIKKFNLNGIKQSSGGQKLNVSESDALNGPRETKRLKLSHDSGDRETSQDVSNRLNQLNGCVANLMRLFKEIMSDSVMSQRSLFPVLFLQQAVVCAREGSTVVTVHLQPEILLDIIDMFSSDLTFELVLAISNLSTTNSRRYAAKAVCKLAQVKESKQSQLVLSHSLSLNAKLGTSQHQATAGSCSSGKTAGSTPTVTG